MKGVLTVKCAPPASAAIKVVALAATRQTSQEDIGGRERNSSTGAVRSVCDGLTARTREPAVPGSGNHAFAVATMPGPVMATIVSPRATTHQKGRTRWERINGSEAHAQRS
jgi:hypothetical protein